MWLLNFRKLDLTDVSTGGIENTYRRMKNKASSDVLWIYKTHFFIFIRAMKIYIIVKTYRLVNHTGWFSWELCSQSVGQGSLRVGWTSDQLWHHRDSSPTTCFIFSSSALLSVRKATVQFQHTRFLTYDFSVGWTIFNVYSIIIAIET